MAEVKTNPNGLIDLKNAAHYVGLCVATLRKLLKGAKTQPPNYRIGSRYYFKKEDLDMWLESFKSR